MRRATLITGVGTGAVVWALAFALLLSGQPGEQTGPPTRIYLTLSDRERTSIATLSTPNPESATHAALWFATFEARSEAIQEATQTASAFTLTPTPTPTPTPTS